MSEPVVAVGRWKMFSIDIQNYGPTVARLLEDGRTSELGPGHPNQDAWERLAGLGIEKLCSGRPFADRVMARCCLAGLWLLHDFLDESHKISQELNTDSGSYWHGIMHRREPDYSNSKYWFRRVGDHAIFADLCEGARELAVEHSTNGDSQYLASQSRWDPYAFVDLCYCIACGRSAAETLARKVALLEWQLLFDYCYQNAVEVR